VDAAYKVHKSLGPGLLESIYETFFCFELKKRGIFFERQKPVVIKYDGVALNEPALRIDVLVDSSIIVEVKAVDEYKKLFEAQLLTYLKLTNKQVGFLINFNVSLIKNGIKRIINNY
jgi:GxxExxY protein